MPDRPFGFYSAVRTAGASAIDVMGGDIDSHDDIAFDIEDDSQVRFDFNSVNRAAIAS